jgi:hypothetical protein
MRAGNLVAPLIVVGGIAVAIGIVVAITYAQVWVSHLEAPIISATDSESRLLITAMVGSLATILVSLLTAIFSAIDRSRVVNSDRTKKAYELSTEAAFAIWKAATTALRLLQRADDCAFTKEHYDEISSSFEDAEKTTLLFDDKAEHAFKLLWNESEAIGGRLLLCGGEGKRKQNMYWRDEHEAFMTLYDRLRLELRKTLSL